MVGAVAVAPAARLGGELRMPGDKSMTHRALLLAGMAAGRSTISDASDMIAITMLDSNWPRLDESTSSTSIQR